MRCISWNVNGLRAVMKKDFEGIFAAFNADIFAVQETKCQPGQVDFAPEGYHAYWSYAAKAGYSGTAVFTRREPLRVLHGCGLSYLDAEGRICALEFPEFWFVCVYTPNAQDGLRRIETRLAWDRSYREFLVGLSADKPVVTCGDFNVAHEPCDLARPEANYGKSAGYTQTEIDGMDALLAAGFADTFRRLHPEARAAYSWWSYRMNARARNVGWRIDYVLASESLFPRVTEAFLLPEVPGSDHCPAGIVLA